MLVAAPVRAQVTAPDAMPSEAAVDPLAIGGADLRMTVPASIAGSAPWPFVIDTAAERTVVSAELAARLAPLPGPVRRVAVVIDTGSPVTIGNAALRALATTPPPSIGPLRVFAGTGEAVDTIAYRLDRVELGDMSFADVPVAVADVAPFRRFGLAAQPALLLGMDVLRLFRSVEIDFANRTIRFALPRGDRLAR